MNNQEFLHAIEKSFAEFVKSGTSRSTAKLRPLHGAIAKDMAERLGKGYKIQSQGYMYGKEGTIRGRYMNKKVDITILHNDKPVCGIAVKFVMQNYSQNSNNYFENMLGETANIRAARCPYFQLFMIPDKLPYYSKGGAFMHWETITKDNLQKYCILDNDDPELFYHSPNKTLIYVLHLPDIGEIKTKNDYLNKYSTILTTHGGIDFIATTSPVAFSKSLILNDYAKFAEKIYHTIKAQ